MAELVEELSGESLDKYVTDSFYTPLNLSHTTFHPTKKFPLSQIIPTENDTSFRKQLVHGFVHDPTVAMLGGVGGSAGLFSNAEDLAVIMQMLLNHGEYQERRYISKETVDLFTQRILSNSHRGAGFAKPSDDLANSATCLSASLKSFGHSGFTGTIVWADPENQLVYIFLSNRVNPTAANNKLIKQNIRTEIQQMFYDILR
jgi:CubicO group peptidase (beta-lactamase class C family)